jgi:hypothetical protein
MTQIEFFKLQAKNLFKDYQTKRKSSDATIGDYEYDPKYFDIEGIILYFDIDEDDFSLMKAQHIIANIVGFRKWTDMLKADESELELAKLLFDNQHKISAEDWEMYIRIQEKDNNTTFDSDFRLEVFKQVFLNVDGHESTFPDYRLIGKTEFNTNQSFHLPEVLPRSNDYKVKDEGRPQKKESQSMEEVLVNDKHKFLNEHYPFDVAPELTDKFRCLHCGEVITVGEYKIFKEQGDDFLYICCPNAPECDGTVIDWIDVDANR